VDVAEKIDAEDADGDVAGHEAFDVDHRREANPLRPERLQRHQDVLVDAGVGGDLPVGAARDSVDGVAERP
jgi:hypothetical protein